MFFLLLFSSFFSFSFCLLSHSFYLSFSLFLTSLRPLMKGGAFVLSTSLFFFFLFLSGGFDNPSENQCIPTICRCPARRLTLFNPQQENPQKKLSLPAKTKTKTKKKVQKASANIDVTDPISSKWVMRRLSTTTTKKKAFCIVEFIFGCLH